MLSKFYVEMNFKQACRREELKFSGEFKVIRNCWSHYDLRKEPTAAEIEKRTELVSLIKLNPYEKMTMARDKDARLNDPNLSDEEYYRIHREHYVKHLQENYGVEAVKKYWEKVRLLQGSK